MAKPESSGAAQIRRRNEIVDAHIHLIRPIAQRLRPNLPPSIHIKDLEQEGALGLLAAAERFDSRRNVPFAAYARLRIRGAMLDWVRREWRPATATEIDPGLADGRRAADEEMMAAESAANIADGLLQIPARQREVVELRSAGMTQRAAGKKMGISQEGARQLELRALKRLRKLVA